MKIIVFVGREHHALKQYNIALELRKRGHDVCYLYSNNGTNIDPPAEYLYRYNIPAISIYDYLDNEAIDDIDKIVNQLKHYSANAELTKHIMPFWLPYSIRESAECLVLFKRILEIESPDAVMVLHSNNFWTKMLLYLAREKGIHTYASQEGLLRHRDQQTMGKQLSSVDYVDTLFTWSESDKEAYIQAGVLSNVIVPVGPFHLDNHIQFKNHPQYNEYKMQFKVQQGYNPHYKLISFFPPTYNRYEGDFGRAALELSAYCQGANLQLAIKPHPFDYNIFDWIEDIIKPYNMVKLYKDTDPGILMACSDIAITQHSTTGIEALYLSTPLVELDLESHGILQSWAEQGLAIKIEDGELDRLSGILSGKIEYNTDKVGEWRGQK